MKTKTKQSIKILCVSAIMLALSVALSFARIKPVPWGGSITLFSMLPVVLVSILYGLRPGLVCSLGFSLFQLWQGISMDGLFAWGLTPGMLTACIALDYILPFLLLGLAGLFRKKGIPGYLCGIALVLSLRFISHILSGVFIFHSAGVLWEGFSTENEWLYSLIYNSTYMLPEIVLTCGGAAALLHNRSFLKLVQTEQE